MPELKEGAKFDDTKIPMHLLPAPAMAGIAEVLGFGAKKYDSWNWYKGIKYSRVFGACLRHLWAWWWGERNDPESGLHHLKHAGCCIAFLITYTTEGWYDNEYDDRPTTSDWNWNEEATQYAEKYTEIDEEKLS